MTFLLCGEQRQLEENSREDRKGELQMINNLCQEDGIHFEHKNTEKGPEQTKHVWRTGMGLRVSTISKGSCRNTSLPGGETRKREEKRLLERSAMISEAYKSISSPAF